MKLSKRFVNTLSVGIILLFMAANAQEFVFVSDRLLRFDHAIVEGDYHLQSDLFIYRSGSEVRLTRTPDQDEYDPMPSPDGRLVAYAAQDALHPAGEQTWAWRFEVIDLLLGQRLASWELPNSRDMTRPAGGFSITWLPDSHGFIAMVPRGNDAWMIHQFTLGESDSTLLADGASPVLSPDGRYLAFANPRIGIFDIKRGEHVMWTAGDHPLGWFDDTHLFVASPEMLELVDITTGERQQLFDYYGLYGTLAWSPSGRHYGFSLLQDDAWYLIIANRNHKSDNYVQLNGQLFSFDWLKNDTLVYSFMTSADDLAIASIDLAGNNPILVDSHMNDFDARAIPR